MQEPPSGVIRAPGWFIYKRGSSRTAMVVKDLEGAWLSAPDDRDICMLKFGELMVCSLYWAVDGDLEVISRALALSCNQICVVFA